VPRGLISGASQQRVLTLCLGGQGAALVGVFAFGYAFSWVFATIGLVTRNPEARNSPPPFANARPRVDQARIVARGLTVAGKPSDTTRVSASPCHGKYLVKAVWLLWRSGPPGRRGPAG
jgi:hypothetical protein